MERPVPTDLPVLERRKPRKGKASVPYWLLLPAALVLLGLFVLPMLSMASLSLQTGSSLEGFVQTFRFANYADVLSKNSEFIVRSIVNAAIVTVAALLLAYPVAYWIAFYGGRRKNVFLLLILLPFFVSQLAE